MKKVLLLSVLLAGLVHAQDKDKQSTKSTEKSKLGEQKRTPAPATSTNKSKGEMPKEGPQPTPAVPYGSQPAQVDE